MSIPRHVVVVGAGLAGIRVIQELRTSGYEGDITLVGDEEHAPYDRPPLSKQVLAGSWDLEKVTLASAEGLAELGVQARLGVAAVGLDGCTVRLADGSEVSGDTVILAVGVRARALPGQPEGAHVVRTIEDSHALGAALGEGKHLLVIGAGFVGGEVAGVATGLGAKVTVVEQQDVPLARILGPEVGRMCGRLISEGGADLRTSVTVTSFDDEGQVVLSDGTRLDVDEVLVGIGGVTDLAWMEGSGVDTSGGVPCDPEGRVDGLVGVWAVGDASAWADPETGERRRHEHWSSAVAQANAVARRLTGVELPESAAPYFWSDQFGVKIQLVGHPERADSVRALHGEGLDGGSIKGTVVGYYAGEELVAACGFSAIRLLAPYKAQLNAAEGAARRVGA